MILYPRYENIDYQNIILNSLIREPFLPGKIKAISKIIRKFAAENRKNCCFPDFRRQIAIEMDILEHISPRLTLFLFLYGGAAVTAVILCLYLLLRRGNAFVADIKPPKRLRRWAAAFFASVALSHAWWLLFYIYSWEARSVSFFLVCLLDCVTMPTTVFGTMLSMLQDRKRPIWPFVAALLPIVVLGLLQIFCRDIDIVTPCVVYTLVLYALFTLYMVVAVNQYGHWLRDNYADLEHKEVRLSHILIVALLLFVVSDEFVLESSFMVYFVRVIDFVLFGILLWRVETLPQLEVSSKLEEGQPNGGESEEHDLLQQKVPVIPSNIGQLLEKHCVDAHLYLQHDLTLSQLAAAVGTNRSYLSQYFSSQGMTYNAYINNLRVNHFVSLYREAVASQRPFTIQQLACDSGYRSYSTFSLSFKQRMGQSVTAWIRDKEE